MNKNDLVRIFEYLIENEVGVTSHPAFRQLLDRNRNLFVNQITRESTNNLAYNSFDFDLTALEDDKIWALLDGSKYSEVIEDNAASAFVKMAEKFDLFED